MSAFDNATRPVAPDTFEHSSSNSAVSFPNLFEEKE